MAGTTGQLLGMMLEEQALVDPSLSGINSTAALLEPDQV
jgi:hypothetical protein